MASMQKGQNSQDIQKTNRALVLRTLLKLKTTTRAQISEETGLKKATVTNIVADFIHWGTVREVGMSTGKSGRRTILIEIVKENYAVIGGWLKRNEFIAGVFDIFGDCIMKESVEFHSEDSGEKIVQNMISLLNRLSGQIIEKKLLGIAVALPGPYIKREDKIVLTTGRKRWMEENIGKRLKEEYGSVVYIEHDVNAAMMAEWDIAGRRDDTENMLYVMLGHGVGGGVIENGKIINGFLGTAGEIGHMSIQYDGRKCECGNRGCLECYCTIEAMMEDIKALLPQYPDSLCKENSNFEDILRAYQANDPLAQKVINQIAKYLGYGLASSINLLNPEMIIIGDELPKAAGELFLETVKETVQERVLPQIFNQMDIQLSTLDNAVLQGVCACLVEKLLKDPEIFEME